MLQTPSLTVHTKLQVNSFILPSATVLQRFIPTAMNIVRRVRERLATASRSRESQDAGGSRQSISRKRARRGCAVSAPPPHRRRVPQPYQPVSNQTIDRRNQMVREAFQSPKHVGPWFSRQRFDTSERLAGDVVLYRLPTGVNQQTGTAVKRVGKQGGHA